MVGRQLIHSTPQFSEPYWSHNDDWARISLLLIYKTKDKRTDLERCGVDQSKQYDGNDTVDMTCPQYTPIFGAILEPQ